VRCCEAAPFLSIRRASASRGIRRRTRAMGVHRLCHLRKERIPPGAKGARHPCRCRGQQGRCPPPSMATGRRPPLLVDLKRPCVGGVRENDRGRKQSEEGKVGESFVATVRVAGSPAGHRPVLVSSAALAAATQAREAERGARGGRGLNGLGLGRTGAALVLSQRKGRWTQGRR
jgi:hypothetical protein